MAKMAKMSRAHGIVEIWYHTIHSSGLKPALELSGEGPGAGAIPELMERVAHDPADHQARYDLALALYAANKKEAAAEALLDIVRRQRNWNEEAARKQLLKYFEAWSIIL